VYSIAGCIMTSVSPFLMRTLADSLPEPVVLVEVTTNANRS